MEFGMDCRSKYIVQIFSFIYCFFCNGIVRVELAENENQGQTNKNKYGYQADFVHRRPLL